MFHWSCHVRNASCHVIRYLEKNFQFTNKLSRNRIFCGLRRAHVRNLKRIMLFLKFLVSFKGGHAVVHFCAEPRNYSTCYHSCETRTTLIIVFLEATSPRYYKFRSFREHRRRKVGGR